MEKEKVLEIKVVKINNEWSGACITYQNEEVLKRGEFEDKELGVCSIKEFFFNIKGPLCLRGSFEELDNKVIVINNEEVSRLLDLVDKINEKYGIVKLWRAEKYGSYYCINSELNINKYIDDYTVNDSYRYKIGNYFQTEKEAVEYVDKIRKLLKERINEKY